MHFIAVLSNADVLHWVLRLVSMGNLVFLVVEGLLVSYIIFDGCTIFLGKYRILIVGWLFYLFYYCFLYKRFLLFCEH